MYPYRCRAIPTSRLPCNDILHVAHNANQKELADRTKTLLDRSQKRRVDRSIRFRQRSFSTAANSLLDGWSPQWLALACRPMRASRAICGSRATKVKSARVLDRAFPTETLDGRESERAERFLLACSRCIPTRAAHG